MPTAFEAATFCGGVGPLWACKSHEMRETRCKTDAGLIRLLAGEAILIRAFPDKQEPQRPPEARAIRQESLVQGRMVLDPSMSKPGAALANASYPGTKQKAIDRFNPAAWTRRHWYLGPLAQLVVVVSIVAFAFGQLAYYTDYYNVDFKAEATTWWGKRTEMIRPIYFILFCIVPLGATLLLVEFLKLYNVHRMSSRYLLRLAMVFRRKPRIGSWLSPFTYGELLFLAILITGNCLAFSLNYKRRIKNAKVAAKKAKKVLDYAAKLKALGTALGYTSIFNVSFLFLPATRNSAWMEFLNISYANGVKYHRWMGIAAVLLAECHCIVFYVLWVHKGEWKEQALPCFDCPLGKPKGKTAWINVFGEISLLCFLTIGATSIPWVRRKFYNVFYYVHHLAFVAVIFLVLHYNGIIWWILPSFLLLLIHRVLSHVNSFVPVQVKEFTTLDNEIVKIVITRSTNLEGHYKVGQFVYLNVPSISKLQWHAFTIGSSPKSSPHSLTILLKSLGDWTKDLVEYSEECKKTNVLPTVYMDGFYGASIECYEEYPTVCLVAGGIGVTPLFAILEDMVAKLTSGLPMTQRVYLIFTFRELSLLEELHPLLMCLRELDPQEKFFTFHLTLTRVPSIEKLKEAVDHKRLSGHHHAVATEYEKTSHLLAQARPQPFAQPLTSSLNKCSMYIIVYVFAVVIVCVLEYGTGKIKRHGRSHLWPLQAFVEIMILFLGAAIVYGLVLAEKVLQARAKKNTASQNFFDMYKNQVANTAAAHHFANEVKTFQDLLKVHNVAVGARPDLNILVRLVRQSHQSFVANNTALAANETIGMFVSGPESLKNSVHSTVASTAPSEFDIHEEEFEL